jgi:hypothetical protein
MEEGGEGGGGSGLFRTSVPSQRRNALNVALEQSTYLMSLVRGLTMSSLTVETPPPTVDSHLISTLNDWVLHTEAMLL